MSCWMRLQLRRRGASMGREAGAKPEVLRRLQSQRMGAPGSFVEDRRATLEAVSRDPWA